jgi:putative transcriptional regulator
MTDTNSISWDKFRENANIKNLSDKDIKVDLIKLKPNAQFPEHTHEETEWLYILEGKFSDQNGTYSKGHFVINEKGSKHATKSGPNGCLVLSIKLLK